MKRWASPTLRIVLFLLLGAIVNVAVAWGCARWNNFDNRRLRLHSVAPIKGNPTAVISPDLHWPSFVPEDWPEIPNALIGRYPGLRVWVGNMTRQQREGPMEGWDALIVYAGWPCLAMECGLLKTVQQISPGSRGWAPALGARRWSFNLSGWIQPRGSREARSVGLHEHLPLLPVWPGFAINTVFYAGILWMLFAAPLALRRRRRLKRGLCLKCAYPIGERAVCTECGAPVRAKELTA